MATRSDPTTDSRKPKKTHDSSSAARIGPTRSWAALHQLPSLPLDKFGSDPIIALAAEWFGPGRLGSRWRTQSTAQQPRAHFVHLRDEGSRVSEARRIQIAGVAASPLIRENAGKRALACWPAPSLHQAPPI